VVAARRGESGRGRAAPTPRSPGRRRSATTTTAASAAATLGRERRAAVDRMIERRAQEVRLVGIVRRDGDACVIRLPAREIAIEAHYTPIHAAVVGLPKLTIVGRTTVQWIAVTGFDQRVHAIGIRARDGESDLADRVRR